jgi:hypothetical protein
MLAFGVAANHGQWIPLRPHLRIDMNQKKAVRTRRRKAQAKQIQPVSPNSNAYRQFVETYQDLYTSRHTAHLIASGLATALVLE